eukprot:Sspe_Gene.83120::Locus_54517_Transcript_1_1_Confidence_1.000_Length_870::g.83120::m.83120
MAHDELPDTVQACHVRIEALQAERNALTSAVKKLRSERDEWKERALEAERLRDEPQAPTQEAPQMAADHLQLVKGLLHEVERFTDEIIDLDGASRRSRLRDLTDSFLQSFPVTPLSTPA